MEINFFHKNVTKAEEKAFTQYIKQKIDAIESLLTKFSEDGRLLKVSLEKFNKHDAYQVEMVLSVPTKSFKACEASHSITKAVDLSKDRLVTQVKKHIAQLQDRGHKSIRKTEIDKKQAVEMLFEE